MVPLFRAKTAMASEKSQEALDRPERPRREAYAGGTYDERGLFYDSSFKFSES